MEKQPITTEPTKPEVIVQERHDIMNRVTLVETYHPAKKGEFVNFIYDGKPMTLVERKVKDGY